MEKRAGFTLIELLVTLSVAAILLVVAVPAFQHFIRTNRVAAQANEFATAFAVARSEAVKRRATVTVCHSAGATTCDGDWGNGWLVFVDDDGDGTRDTAPAELILRVQQGLQPGFTLAAAGGEDFIRFDTLGASRDGAVDFTLTPPSCPAGQPDIRDIAVSPTGQVTVTEVDC